MLFSRKPALKFLRTEHFLFFFLGVFIANSESKPNSMCVSGIGNNDVRIHCIQTGFSRVYLLEGKCGMILVDGGCPRNASKVISVMKELGRKDLRLIFITHAHFDHYGSADKIRKLTGALIAIHRADAEAMAQGATPLGIVRGTGKFAQMMLPLGELFLRPPRTKADILLDDGDSLDQYGIHAKVVHTPGHTPGSSCLLVEDSLAFVGDLIGIDHGHVTSQDLFGFDWHEIAKSVDKLKSFNLAFVFTGHDSHIITRKELMAVKPYIPD